MGWIEGLKLELFGGVLGLNIRRPALKLPGVGRLGLGFALIRAAFSLVDRFERSRGK